MDAPTRRRRAASAVFDTVLGDDDLLAALWMQHDSMSGDAVSDIIRYVDAVAERFAIDPGTRKRLYESLHRTLRLADDDLPIDPWPAMLAVRPAAAAPRAGARTSLAAPWPVPSRQVTAPPHEPPYQPPYQPPFQPAYNPQYPTPQGYVPAGQAYPAAPPGYVPAPPVYAPPGGYVPLQAAPVFEALPVVSGPVVAPVVVPPPVVEPPAPSVDASIWTPDSGVPPEQAVFAELIASIAADIAQTHAGDFDDWRASWLTLLERQRPASSMRAQLVSACKQLAPGQLMADRRIAWRLALPGAKLAEQVHQLYVALCEALGPVGADQVLNRAVKLVEQTPAARLYSPRKLM